MTSVAAMPETHDEAALRDATGGHDESGHRDETGGGPDTGRNAEVGRDDTASGDGLTRPVAETAEEERTDVVRERARRLVRALTARRRVGPSHQRIALAVSAVAFIVFTIVAARSLPSIDGGVRWGFFVAVGLIGVPARTWATGEEFAILARLTGHRVGRVERLRVALVGNAANLLPLPGSVLVRAQVLRRRGATLRSIGWATAMTGIMWAGSTVLVAGILLGALSGPRLLGAALAVAGAGACVGVTAAFHRRRELTRPRWHAFNLFAIEVMFVAVGGFRLWGIMVGLGFDVGVEQAVALTVAGVVTTAVGFAPGGLGVRELMAAAISPIVGLPVSVGVLAAALNRIIQGVVLAPVTVGLLLHPERVPSEEPVSEDLIASSS